MRTHVRNGEVVGVGSVNHAELARLQTAAKKRSSSTKPKDEAESKPTPPKPEPAPAPTAKPTP